jgi:hypothetical protein
MYKSFDNLTKVYLEWKQKQFMKLCSKLVPRFEFIFSTTTSGWLLSSLTAKLFHTCHVIRRLWSGRWVAAKLILIAEFQFKTTLLCVVQQSVQCVIFVILFAPNWPILCWMMTKPISNREKKNVHTICHQQNTFFNNNAELFAVKHFCSNCLGCVDSQEHKQYEKFPIISTLWCLSLPTIRPIVMPSNVLRMWVCVCVCERESENTLSWQWHPPTMVHRLVSNVVIYIPKLNTFLSQHKTEECFLLGFRHNTLFVQDNLDLWLYINKTSAKKNFKKKEQEHFLSSKKSVFRYCF